MLLLQVVLARLVGTVRGLAARPLVLAPRVLLTPDPRPWLWARGLTAVQAAVGVVTHGLRPEMPRGTPAPVADLIRACWAAIPEQRPSFTQIEVQLACLLEQARAGRLAAGAAGQAGGLAAASPRPAPAPAPVAGGGGGRGGGAGLVGARPPPGGSGPVGVAAV
ncbi:putative serine/threonine-protein kinase [Tetrabaena socialis]|uniref:Putative serine/threonine-protein kinase n=1 Tax=Tetrabaena socialis TaxID=47790 RepID=A0A2J8A6Z2_9CHLO|nr:putative serine/threonine-protein kinase [Tetrabaena socialis]|eukprot:PNH08260.1 putative serine/threonine-protein kinase [Tetrabaena socialis]